MFRSIKIDVNAANPNLPLQPIEVCEESAATLTILNVPKSLGKRTITGIYVGVINSDYTAESFAAVREGSAWQVTIPSDAIGSNGTVENGIMVTASGTDENGEAVEQWIIGMGDLVVMAHDGTVSPGVKAATVRLMDDVPTSPKAGNLAKIGDVYKLYNGTSWVALGGGVTLDDEVAEDSANGVKSSGIWSFVKGLFAARKINGKALSNDVTLTAGDVGAQGSLSEDQLAAVNSGITAAKVASVNLNGVAISSPNNGQMDIKAGNDLLATISKNPYNYLSAPEKTLITKSLFESAIVLKGLCKILDIANSYIARYRIINGRCHKLDVIALLESSKQYGYIIGVISNGVFIPNKNTSEQIDIACIDDSDGETKNQSIIMLTLNNLSSYFLLRGNMSGSRMFGDFDELYRMDQAAFLDEQTYSEYLLKYPVLGKTIDSFDYTKSYSIGDIVCYHGEIYRAKEDQETGKLYESKWDKLTLIDLIKLVESTNNAGGLTESAQASLIASVASQIGTAGSDMQTAVDARVEAKGSGIKVDDQGRPYVEY